MAHTPPLVEEPPIAQVELGDIGTGPGGPGQGRDGERGPGPGGRSRPVPQRSYVTGLTMGLAAILMFFMALVSAFIVRKGLSDDWRAFPLPPILWLNTAILFVSSITIQVARRRLGREDVAAFRRWWTVTTGLGLLFVAGQLIAWRQLAHEGVYLASNPSSSFFYLLTAAHGVHLLGGIIALIVIGWRSWQNTRVTRSTATEMAAIYWHFMDGLWIFLFLLLMMGQ
ncbi:MAG TPA: heme-copper oxidase subunit III [Candidatus Dormibacteraeota bacterium]|nr:heme-copper oxidase subunit III [Candidatus Dormibacteraeota bacterium]